MVQGTVPVGISERTRVQYTFYSAQTAEAMDAEMMATNEEAQVQDEEYVEELARLLTIAKHPGVVTLLKTSIANAKTTSPSHAQRLPASKKVAGEKHGTSTIKIKEYGWDQSDKFVKIYISSIPNIEKVTADKVHHQFSERSFSVEIPIEHKVYALIIKDLLHSIVPDQCSVKTRSGLISIQLRKKVAQSWECLLVKEKKANSEKDSPLTDKDDPSAGLMKLMKKMYDEGDDDMKRTISKTWYEAQQKRGSGMDDF